METWDAYLRRQNVRSFAEQPIEPAVLDRILEAGRRSPSGSNRQAWDFVVVTDRDQLGHLAGVWRGAGHVAGSAATIALVTPIVDDETRMRTNAYDLGQATMAMAVVAADAGLGSAHSAVGDQDMAREILGFPEDQRCAYLFSLGYPVDGELRPIRNMKRRPFDEVVHRGRW